jgi:hypothetical protein
MNDELLCPKCGSNQLSANKKGFSGKKAVAGAILTGGIGVLAGTIGSNKIKITCLACGHVFKPGQDQKSVEKQKQQQAEAMKKPGFWIFVVVLIIIFIWIIKSCNDSNSTNSSDSNSTNNSEQKQSATIDISNIEFIILNNDYESRFTIDVYVKNKSDIQRLNDYFVNKYDSDGKSYLYINYFDNKEIGLKYFSLLNDPKYSEKQLDGFFSHYIAAYKCNPSTNYKSLDYMHK